MRRPLGLEQRHHGQTVPGKNATDIALAVDAMDILYSGAIEHFCLVASDSDYTPLVMRLRSAGCKVLVIGKPTTPLALKTAGTEVLSTDQLLSKPAQRLPIAQPEVPSGSEGTASVPELSPTGALLAGQGRSFSTGPLVPLMPAYEEGLKR